MQKLGVQLIYARRYDASHRESRLAESHRMQLLHSHDIDIMSASQENASQLDVISLHGHNVLASASHEVGFMLAYW